MRLLAIIRAQLSFNFSAWTPVHEKFIPICKVVLHTMQLRRERNLRPFFSYFIATAADYSICVWRRINCRSQSTGLKVLISFSLSTRKLISTAQHWIQSSSFKHCVHVLRMTILRFFFFVVAFRQYGKNGLFGNRKTQRSIVPGSLNTGSYLPLPL